MYYFVDSGPKFTGLVWLNAGGIARDHMSFRFLISCVVLESRDQSRKLCKIEPKFSGGKIF